MKKYTFLFIVIILLAMTVAPITAQDDAEEEECAVMIEEALAVVGDACDGLGRNEACYGNTQIAASGWEDAELEFSEPGDITDIVDIASLSTSPLNMDENIWGVALLALQANLPDTMPGQNVTFVLFGDVTLENEVNPDEVVIAPTLTAISTGNLNIRSGPGTGYVVAGTLSTDEEITINGRNEAGDWLQFVYDGDIAWIYTPLMTIEDDIDMLLVTDGDSGTSYSAPMQAFRLTTGIGDVGCEDAPRDGIMVQAPTDTTVNFLINGVEVEIGSTALMRLNEDDDSLQIANLAGSVIVKSGEEEVELEVAQQVNTVSGAAPIIVRECEAADPSIPDRRVAAAQGSVELRPRSIAVVVIDLEMQHSVVVPPHRHVHRI